MATASSAPSLSSAPAAKLVVSFHNHKLEFTLDAELTVLDVKTRLIKETSTKNLLPSNIKLLFKGKVFNNDDQRLSEVLKGKKQVYKIMAMGRSSTEVEEIQETHATAQQQAPRIRDDLTQQGQRDAARRKQLGRQMLQQASQKERPLDSGSDYGFGCIETLPNLPHQDQARAILTELAHDPGVLACMRKHNWKVGSLAELYPEGKVGETAVCVMGLNKNKGQQILLRIRTDDLQGFRKMLSIRKVLFHELAHNVHSEHDNQFFQLMRQIERECNEMDWTQGDGLSSSDDVDMKAYSGGTFRLGGGGASAGMSKEDARELRARAALSRMTAEEEEIQQHCGCGREAKFLPESLLSNNHNNKDNETDSHDMDLS